ncbi:MAG: polysaccharide deacetylase family protein [Abditibacteriales bacterium]|nr:polysaccharide deacetylase family protein [Abditibacteriales bacterium]MDW8367113.1 polysaccharide deacetylase family protein [Abditibacteriales bacterium]
MVWYRRTFAAVVAVAGILALAIFLRLRQPAGAERPPYQEIPPLPTSPQQEEKEENKPKNLVFSAPERYQAVTVHGAELAGKEKVIALTFDDGPWPKTTAQVLDILKQHQVKATFFWIGQHLQNNPAIGRKVVADGHAIGNHTWHHRYHRVDAATAAREIDDTAALIFKVTGAKTFLFRPPGGNLRNGLAAYAKKKKHTIVMWSISSADTNRRASAQSIIHSVLRGAHRGGIVLMHDGGGNRSATVRALPHIIAGLKKKGYKFVTVPELLEMCDKELKSTAASQSVKPVTAQPAVE